MIKIAEIKSETRNCPTYVLSVIKIYFDGDFYSDLSIILTNLKQKYQDDNYFFSLSYSNGKSGIRISIHHFEEDILEVKEIMKNIIGNNHTSLYLYQGMRNYYSFLSELFILHLEF